MIQSMNAELKCIDCKAVKFKEFTISTSRPHPNRDNMKDMYCRCIKKYVEDYYDSRHPECPLHPVEYDKMRKLGVIP